MIEENQAQVAGPEAESRSVASPSGAAQHRRGDGQRILLVEDVPQLREILARQLEHAGYRVLGAADGLAALALIEHEPVDLLLSDLVMPQLGGALLVDHVRARCPGVRCLLMTGYQTNDVPSGVPVLRKPFTTAELMQSVHAALDAGLALDRP